MNEFTVVFAEVTVGSHLSTHGGKIPHAAHNSPAAHHTQQVVDHSVLAAVPEGVSETGIVLGKSDTPE